MGLVLKLGGLSTKKLPSLYQRLNSYCFGSLSNNLLLFTANLSANRGYVCLLKSILVS